MKRTKNVKTALIEIERSAKYVQGRRKKYLIFEDRRAREWFGLILDPQSDYRYEWLLETLHTINTHLASQDNLDHYNEREAVDALVSTNTKDLNAWIHDRPTKFQYLKAAQKTDRTTRNEHLVQAQRNAITETVYLANSRIKRLLTSEQTHRKQEQPRIMSPIAMNYLKWICLRGRIS